MIIIPAIDIKDGKCVRLFQGDFSKETIYSDDPLEMALKWKNLGAQIVHVVDLEGAKDGTPFNFEVISKIAKEVNIEVGGGIRSIATIQKYLDAGVYRVVLGTIVLEDFDLAKEIFEKFNNKVIVGLDAKNGELMKKGWVSESGLGIFETAKKLEELGAKRIIYTDILKDGSLTEPNYKMIKRLIDKVNIPVIASGGVAFIDQILQLKRIGADGVIIGKALYEGSIDLKEAIDKC